MSEPTAVPTSTYRFQISASFTLSDARAQLPYLHALGAGAVYLSPLLRATKGSDHGYDVVDHSQIDPDRGTSADLQRLCQDARELGLEVVIDIVPNHMGVADASQNSAWWELLKNGRAGWSGNWFDVDWNHPGRILIPVLGDDFEPARDLALVDDELRYYEHRYPVAPGTGAGTAAEVHDRQHYELVSFRRADTEQNYRRFFAVTELAGLRVQDQAVFEATHSEILRWVDEYGVSGIRIDHPDGLVDPEGYLQSLRAAAPQAWIVVEKITEPGERLPSSWPVAGMTGYDALTEVNSVLVDPSAAGRISQAYLEIDDRSWGRQIEEGKRHVATTILQAEIRRMARLVEGATQRSTDVDVTALGTGDVVAALTELAVAFPVYRSYLPLGANYLSEAVATAISRRPHLAGTIDQLLPRLQDPADELALRFQQATGAIMAKGVEDTAYYRYSPLISLNEVGGYPGVVGMSLADFHTSQLRRQAEAPQAMTTLSTHDTKRGEDIRARISVLAEIMDEWQPIATKLSQLAPIPNPAFGYLLWQTVVATGLIEPARLHAYAEKAMREASEGSRWIDPDSDFEDFVHAAVDAAYSQGEVRELVEGMHRRIVEPAWSNSLSQKLIQLTMPGIPDVYQGSELWEDSLVDPDNRRPVDFADRAELLRRLDESPIGSVPSGAVRAQPDAKMWITSRALRARREHRAQFSTYRPIYAAGPRADHAVAFDRGAAVTVATRLPVALEAAGGWNHTTLTLADGVFHNVLTGRRHAGTVELSDLLAEFPVALLLPSDQ